MNKAVNFIYKVIKFFKNYLFKDPVFVLKYFIAYFQKGYAGDAKFYNNSEFVEQIKLGKSFIRIGDGEVGLMHHRDISYQKCDKLLITKLTEIIENYSDDSNYVLSMPIFVNMTNKELENTNGKLSCWLPLKVEYFRRFNRSMHYFDAHTFYKKNFFEENIYEYLKNKKLIINTAQRNIDEQKENIEKHFEVLEWIPSQEPNPFDLYLETTRQLDSILLNYERGEINRGEIFNKNDIVFILGSGPMSKVLAYDFSKKGVQCIDIGKGFEQLYNDKNYEDEI